MLLGFFLFRARCISEIHGSYACFDCHEVVDKRRSVDLPSGYVQLMFFRGMKRTQDILIEKGLIKL